MMMIGSISGLKSASESEEQRVLHVTQVSYVSFQVPLAHLWMDFHSFSHWMWRSSFAFWHNVLGVLR